MISTRRFQRIAVLGWLAAGWPAYAASLLDAVNAARGFDAGIAAAREARLAGHEKRWQGPAGLLPRAQIDAALAAGIDVTHLDDHMGAVMAPEFIDIYHRLGRDYGLPILLVKDLERFNPMTYAGPTDTRAYDRVVAKAAGEGDPIFDLVLETPWDRQTDAASAYRAMFADISEGLTYLALHFNAPGDFEAIEPELAHVRTEEYAFFRSGQVRPLLERHDIEVIGMRRIRETLRARRAKGKA